MERLIVAQRQRSGWPSHGAGWREAKLSPGAVLVLSSGSAMIHLPPRSQFPARVSLVLNTPLPVLTPDWSQFSPTASLASLPIAANSPPGIGHISQHPVCHIGEIVSDDETGSGLPGDGPGHPGLSATRCRLSKSGIGDRIGGHRRSAHIRRIP